MSILVWPIITEHLANDVYLANDVLAETTRPQLKLVWVDVMVTEEVDCLHKRNVSLPKCATSPEYKQKNYREIN